MTKPIDWRGSSLKDLQAFPDDAKHRAGYQLRKVQQGDQPDEFKPTPEIGGEKTNKTSQGDKDIAKRRYGAVLIERKTK